MTATETAGLSSHTLTTCHYDRSWWNILVIASSLVSTDFSSEEPTLYHQHWGLTHSCCQQIITPAGGSCLPLGVSLIWGISVTKAGKQNIPQHRGATNDLSVLMSSLSYRCIHIFVCIHTFMHRLSAYTHLCTFIHTFALIHSCRLSQSHTLSYIHLLSLTHSRTDSHSLTHSYTLSRTHTLIHDTFAFTHSSGFHQASAECSQHRNFWANDNSGQDWPQYHTVKRGTGAPGLPRRSVKGKVKG